MDKYKVLVDKRVAKFFNNVPAKHVGQLKAKLDALQDLPFPQDSKKLHGGGYRVTAGEYRIIYTVDEPAKTVTIFEIARRNDLKYRF